jgi:hypothetical protein
VANAILPPGNKRHVAILWQTPFCHLVANAILPSGDKRHFATWWETPFCHLVAHAMLAPGGERAFATRWRSGGCHQQPLGKRASARIAAGIERALTIMWQLQRHCDLGAMAVENACLLILAGGGTMPDNSWSYQMF